MRKQALKKNAAAVITPATPLKPEIVNPGYFQAKNHLPLKTVDVPAMDRSWHRRSIYKPNSRFRKKGPSKESTLSLHPVGKACKDAILSWLEISPKTDLASFRLI